MYSRFFKLIIGIFFIWLFGAGTNLFAQSQNYFKTKSGSLEFISDAPLEMIKANSSALAGVINPQSGEFAFSLAIESFDGFNGPLQKVHFNENYLESNKYPKATFSGKFIEDVDFETEGIYDVRAKGKLIIHGIEQERIIKGRIIVKAGQVSIAANFNVPLEDHQITIPKIVHQKIATLIEVILKADLIRNIPN